MPKMMYTKWYDICNDFSLSLRNDAPEDYMEMTVTETEVGKVYQNSYEEAVYLQGIQGLNNTYIDVDEANFG